MRLLRSFWRLRLVSMLLFVVVMVYTVGVLRSSYSLDSINSASVRARVPDKDGMSLRSIKVDYFWCPSDTIILVYVFEANLFY